MIKQITSFDFNLCGLFRFLQSGEFNDIMVAATGRRYFISNSGPDQVEGSWDSMSTALRCEDRYDHHVLKGRICPNGYMPWDKLFP